MTAARFPVRACLAGEDLDWTGGRAVTVALALRTTVRIVPASRPAPAADATLLAWTAGVWSFLTERLPGMPAGPPAVRVSSEAPGASGLSSSTAVILGLFAAFAASAPVEVSRAQLVEWAYAFEFTICHGGGMDQLAITLGGAVLFDGRPTGLPAVLDRVDLPADWAVLVIDSGTPKSTQHHIRSVRAQVAAGDPVFTRYVRESDAAAVRIWAGIRSRELGAVAEGMTCAHRAMRDLQKMSTPDLEHLRALARRSTGQSLKVSGAGGGGALVGICTAAAAAGVADALRRAYRGLPGVRVLVTGTAPSVGSYS